MSLTVREVAADVIRNEGGIGILKRLYDKITSRFQEEGLNPPNKESIREVLGSHTIKDPEGRIGRSANTSGVKFERLSNGIYKIADENGVSAVIEGDARNLAEAGLEEDSVDLIIADHPWSEGHNHRSGNQKNFAQDYENTTFMYEKFDFEQKFNVLKDGGYCVENIPAENHVNTKYLRKIREHAESAGFYFYALVPYRKFDVPKNTGRTQKDREYLLVLHKGPKARRLAPKGKPYMTREMLPAEFDVTKEMKELQKTHQAEKPVALWERVIHLLTEPGEVILDQYSGSGGASEAAVKTGRFPIAIELLKENIKKIRSRLGLPVILDERRKEKKQEKFERTFRANSQGQLALF